MPEVSVIIPIYNVGRFIGRCAESLMRQTLRDVEFIFVNDCTPDDSLAVLESVISRYDRDVKIICLLYTSPSPRDRQKSRMPSSA